MSETQRTSRTVPVGPTLTADGSSDSSVRKDGSTIAFDRLYPIDQTDRQQGLEEEEQPAILWGDVFIESRHPRLLVASSFSS